MKKILKYFDFFVLIVWGGYLLIDIWVETSQLFDIVFGILISIYLIAKFLRPFNKTK